MIYLAAIILLLAFSDPPVALCDLPPPTPAGLYVDLPKTGNVFEIPAPKTATQLRFDAQCKGKK